MGQFVQEHLHEPVVRSRDHGADDRVGEVTERGIGGGPAYQHIQTLVFQARRKSPRRGFVEVPPVTHAAGERETPGPGIDGKLFRRHHGPDGAAAPLTGVAGLGVGAGGLRSAADGLRPGAVAIEIDVGCVAAVVGKAQFIYGELPYFQNPSQRLPCFLARLRILDDCLDRDPLAQQRQLASHRLPVVGQRTTAQQRGRADADESQRAHPRYSRPNTDR